MNAYECKCSYANKCRNADYIINPVTSSDENLLIPSSEQEL